MYCCYHEKARGTDMPSSPEQLIPEADKASATSTWLRRFMMIGLTILIWVALVGIFFWFLGVIAAPVLLLFLATVLAYVLYPLVKLLSRYVCPCHASSLLPRCSFCLLKGSAQLCLHPGLGLYAPFLHSRHEGRMVAFGLVRIGLSKRGNGAIEEILVPHVAADLCRVTGARVRPCQSCRAQLDVRGKYARVHHLDLRRPLHIPQLSHIEISAIVAGPA